MRHAIAVYPPEHHGKADVAQLGLSSAPGFPHVTHTITVIVSTMTTFILKIARMTNTH